MIFQMASDERKTFFDEQLKFEQEKHKLKMEELEFMRESDRVHHERELERGRIKSAEIRKAEMRRQGTNAYKY